MPLLPGANNVGRNIKELHEGPRYAENVRKFGKQKADQIAVAAAESAARRGGSYAKLRKMRGE